ncbi:hypothetical protein [Phenylobacterium sp.]|uniref:hypothetical protein n=1 Tax=Phenylobacterium sp. TaxID=1871053 RepID=UPI0035C87BFC
MSLADQTSHGRPNGLAAGAAVFRKTRAAFDRHGPFASAERAPSVTFTAPGGKRITLATDRVRARPALSSTLSGAIGVTAVGLGVCGLLFPRTTARKVGLKAGPATVMALFGLRELATGLRLVSDPTRTSTLWARTAFDLFDIAVLKALDNHRNPRRGAARSALGFVLAVTALDILAGARLSHVQRNCETGGR